MSALVVGRRLDALLAAAEIYEMSDFSFEKPLELLARVVAWTDEEWSQVLVDGSDLRGTGVRLMVVQELTSLLIEARS